MKTSTELNTEEDDHLKRRLNKVLETRLDTDKVNIKLTLRILVALSIFNFFFRKL